jgi:hypothetical protein
MTRKHFQIVANALGNDMWQYVKLNEEVTPKMVENRYGYTIQAMYECNPNFDDQRFIAAIVEAANRQRRALAKLADGAIVV